MNIITAHSLNDEVVVLHNDTVHKGKIHSIAIAVSQDYRHCTKTQINYAVEMTGMDNRVIVDARLVAVDRQALIQQL